MPSEAHVGTAAVGGPGRNPATLLSVRMNESLGELRSRGQPKAAVPNSFLLETSAECNCQAALGTATQGSSSGLGRHRGPRRQALGS